MKSNNNFVRRIDRREAIKWVMTVAAGAAALDNPALAATRGVYKPGAAATAEGKGYGTDPNVIKIYKPGMVWDLTLSDEQLKTVSALCDVIIPADDKSPAASAVAVPEFIDEWISAPYPEQQADRKVILEGLEWLEKESQKRFKKGFADLSETQQHNICDDICHAAKAKPEFKKAAGFFGKFRTLTAGGFYTTPKGMKDIGYVGNMPVKTFAGPPPEVRKKLGLA